MGYYRIFTNGIALPIVLHAEADALGLLTLTYRIEESGICFASVFAGQFTACHYEAPAVKFVVLKLPGPPVSALFSREEASANRLDAPET